MVPEYELADNPVELIDTPIVAGVVPLVALTRSQAEEVDTVKFTGVAPAETEIVCMLGGVEHGPNVNDKDDGEAEPEPEPEPPTINVIETGCEPFVASELAMITAPLYVPAARPIGLTLMLTAPGVEPFDGVALSQDPPELVDAAAV
jgi:hypothetical protein